MRCYGFARQLNKYGVETEILSFADNLGAKYGEKELEMSLADKLRYNFLAFKRLAQESKQSIFFLQRLNYHSLAPLLVNLLHKNRLVFDCDDWNIRENPKYYFGLFPSSKMEYAVRKIARHANLCITASSYLKEYFNRFNKKTYYLPTGVDTNSFCPQAKPDGPKLVFSWIGTVYHAPMRDNLIFILSCFSTLAEEFDNIFLYLAGDGKYYEELKGKMSGSKFSDRIKFFPWIHPDSIPEHLSGIDIGLLPLIQNSYFNQAKSPTKLFEYMAMGKPVVCSGIGEAKNIISSGQTGILAYDRAAFISAMKALILDAKFRRNIGEKAAQEIQIRYSLNVLGKELNLILKSLDG